MNRNLYRIVFNVKRGQLMAVAETTSSQGKDASGESRGGGRTEAPASNHLEATLSALSFAAMCVIGTVLWALPFPSAQAQIVTDPSASASQRPTVLQTANGLPQVNIQTPSAAGVSRNTYSQFDVQHNGAILNNSRTDTSTQLGGWVQANPWLATGAARVILNEVNSSNPSQLNGYVEVAGQRAEVIIANPAGITVNGGGFLNASSVTLTTGTPVINTGSLESYRVQRGSVSIDGAGLDTSTADYTNILARAVQVNAGIWAKDLKVVTGTNEIAANNAAAPTVTGVASASGAAPSFALDVATLGGMYAGKIFLVGTEAGVGMRNSGAIGASAGDVVLQNNGWLTNSGTVYANGNTSVTSQSSISNQANGLIAAQGNTTITANSLSSSANSVLGAGIKTDGTLTASGNLGITTIQSLSANGQTLAAGDVTLSGSSVDLSGSQTSAANIGITATAGNVSTVNATVATRGTTGILGITAKANNNQSLNNTQGVLSAGQLNLDVANLNNTQGQVIQIGSGDTTIALTSPTGTLNNTGGTIASNGNTTLSAQTLTSNQGQVTALGTLGIHLNTATGGGALSNTQGLIAANGDVSVTASSFDNTLGTLASVQSNLSLVTTGVTTNDSGKIQAALDVTLTNAGLSNTRTGSISGRHLSINTGGQALNNAGGTLAASQSANLQTGALNNDGGLIQTGADLTLNTHAQTLTNTHAANYTSSNTQLNGKGGIAAQGTATLTTGDLNNDAGYLGSHGALLATSANISNTQGGQIQGLDNITLTAVGGRINNSAGLIRSALATSLSAANIDNSNTSGTNLGLEGTDVTIAATSIANDSGAIRAGNSITLTSMGSVNNNAGLMIAGQNLAVNANSLGGDGKVLSKGNLGLTLNNSFSNSGEVTANGNATIASSGDVSNSGKLQAGQTLSVNANNIDNTATGDMTGKTTQINAANTLTNRGLIDGQDTQINVNTINNIGTGRIYGDRLSIAATNLTNDTETVNLVTSAGTLAARDRLDLGISGTLTNREHALIYSVGDMAIGGALDASRQATGHASTLNNNSATIEAGGNLRIASTTLNNTNEHFTYEIRVATVEVNVREDINSRLYRVFTRTTYLPNQSSSDPAQILAGGDITLDTQNARNYASHVVAGGTLSSTSSTLQNEDVMATKSVHDAGTTYTLVYVPQSGNCGKIQINCVHAHDEWWSGPYDSTATSTVAVAQTTASSATGTHVAVRTNTSVGASTSGTDSASVRSGAIVQVNASTAVVQGVSPNTTLPASSLYKTSPTSTAHYLIETDTRFISKQKWLSSDYMTQNLSLDPSVTQKRLGDGFYEQKLIREQVAQLTGRRFLGDYSSDEQEYQALMDNAITYAKQYNLRPGIALSAAQMAQLTSDIVWLVEQSVTLPDGSQQKVLVPQLYAKVQPGDLSGSGALLAGKNVNLNLTGDLTNSATIAGRVVQVSAENVNNLGGRLNGDAVNVAARQDLNNIGGQISAASRLSATAGRDLNVQTTTQSTNTVLGSASFSRSTIDRVAGLSVTGANGTLLTSAGRDVNLTAGVIANSGSGSTSITAGNNLNLATVQTGEQNSITWDADNHLRYGNTTEAGSQINAAGNVALSAGRDLNARAANVQAAGALTASTGNNVNLTAGQNTSNLDEAHKVTTSGILSSTTLTTRTIENASTAQSSNFGGNTVTAVAGNDLKVTGSNIVSDTAATLLAKNNITIEAAKTTHSQTSYQQTSESGFLSGGGIGITIGTREQSLDQQNQNTGAAASTVGSIGGNVSITAGNTYTQTGSDIKATGVDGTGNTVAGAGNIDISAKTVNIKEARETSNSATEQKYSQSGISVAITNPVITALQGAANTAQSMGQAAGQTSNSRMQALAAASTVLAAKSAAGDVQKLAADPSKASSVGISISIGSSESKNNSASNTDSARGSNLNAVGDIHIAATGAGQDSNLTVQGSSIAGGNTTALSADNQVNLLAAANNIKQTSSNTSSSASLGVAFTVGSKTGFSVNASASQANGNGNGDGTTYTNSQISGDTVAIKSAGDTTLKGAVVKGRTVTADVGGNLSIQSLQDKNTYNESSQNASAGVSICVPPFCVGMSGASVGAGASKIDSNYQSVQEQSAIQAGDGGFQVKAKGDTTLIGGVIASTDKAVADNKNSFQTGGKLSISEVQNAASYNAESSQVSVGVGSMAGGSAGVGQDSAKASSTTTAGISGLAGNTAVRTGDAQTGIAQIFDANKVKNEVNAQVAITSSFGSQASKAVGTYADAKAQELKAQGNTEEAKKWEEGGAYRSLAHAAIGGLTGGASGAAGAGAAAYSADAINKITDGLPEGVKNVVGAAIAAGIGSVAGGGSVAGAATAFNADLNNRQLHPSETQRIKELAKTKASEVCHGDTSCETKANLYWTDMLERAAEGKVDTQEAVKSQAYYQQIIAAAEKPGSEASLGAAQNYFNALGEAKKILNADAGKPIVDSRGNPVLGTDGKPQTYFTATQAQRDNPYGNIFPGGSPNTQASVIPGKERRDQDRLERLNTPNGQAVPDTTIEETLFGMRVPGKGAGAVVQVTERNTASALVGTAKAAEEALLRSGGAFDTAGNPLLDMKALTTEQKRVIGEQLFGPNTVRQIVPEGQQIARMQGKGSNGLDQLYKVNRPDVDYVNIEYKFVGDYKKTGAQALGGTTDGIQGSSNWILGSDRIVKAAGREVAADVEVAVKSGRYESLVVTVRPNGSTEIQVLDAFGKPKPTDTSKITLPKTNLSGAQP